MESVIKNLLYYTMENAKYFLFISVITVVGAVLFLVNAFSPANNKQSTINKTAPSQLTTSSNSMKLTSPVFENNGNIPKKYTCDGEAISPPLAISDVPQDALSLVLIMDDPDAPMAGGFVHWVVFNLDPATKEIKENSKPAGGIEGLNSSGKTGYASPCPPSGVHHYQFKLFALDEKLQLDKSAKREDVEKATKGHILGQAVLVGLYQRQ